MKDKLFISSVVCAAIFTGCVSLNSVERKENFSYSPLHTAVFLNNEDVISSVITKDNIDIKDNFGDTPLIDAVRNNFTQTARILLCNNADKEVRDNNKLSLTDLAVRNNNAQIISMLKDENKSFCQINLSTKVKAVASIEEVKIISNQIDNNTISKDIVRHKESKQQNESEYNGFILANTEYSEEQNSEPEIATKLKEYSTEKYVYRDKIDGELIDDKFLDAYIGEDDKPTKKSSKKFAKDNIVQKSKIVKETKQTQKNDFKVEASSDKKSLDTKVNDIKLKVEPKKSYESIVENKDSKSKKVEIQNSSLLVSTPKIEEISVVPIVQIEQKKELLKNDLSLVVKNDNKENSKPTEKKQENKKEQDKIIDKQPLTITDRLQIVALQNYIRFDKTTSTFTTSHAVLDKKFKILLDNLTSSIYEISNNNNKKIKQIVIKSHTSSEHRLTNNIVERNYLNLILSQVRADEILQYLLSLKIDKSILVAKGFGSKFLLLNQDGKENADLSRRTEIEVIFDE